MSDTVGTLPPEQRPRKSAFESGVVQHAVQEARKKAEADAEAERAPLWFRVEDGAHHNLRPGEAVIRFGGGGFRRLAHDRHQARLAEWQGARAGAVREAVAASDAHKERDRLAERIAEAEALVASTRQAHEQALADARSLLTAGKDPSKAEQKARQAAADLPVFENRVPVLRELHEKAAEAARQVEREAERAFGDAFAAERKAERERLHGELRQELTAWLEKAAQLGFDEVRAAHFNR